jgi:hypothetical protein
MIDAISDIVPGAGALLRKTGWLRLRLDRIVSVDRVRSHILLHPLHRISIGRRFLRASKTLGVNRRLRWALTASGEKYCRDEQRKDCE